ncbi:YqjK family protein [Undibacterium sp. Ji22W]|uniref:YqjK family protein n=1 Tax=Undibacterium sp. Ji22W TaxID=3413038 RepID=UPI003BF053E6
MMFNTQKISRSDILQARRQMLLVRCRLQRQQLVWQGAQLHHELRFVELGLSAARTVRASPILIAAITVGLAIIKPRRALWLVKTGLSSWRLWQKFAPVLMPLMPVLRAWQIRTKKTSGATGASSQTQAQTAKHADENS